MIAENASKAIKQAVCYELQNIVKEYGPVYASPHEGFAVLLEEVEEAEDDIKHIQVMIKELWESVKINFITDNELFRIRHTAEALAAEAVQVAAVCERFMETLKK